jgi:hypothetical protein
MMSQLRMKIKSRLLHSLGQPNKMLSLLWLEFVGVDFSMTSNNKQGKILLSPQLQPTQFIRICQKNRRRSTRSLCGGTAHVLDCRYVAMNKDPPEDPPQDPLYGDRSQYS